MAEDDNLTPESSEQSERPRAGKPKGKQKAKAKKFAGKDAKTGSGPKSGTFPTVFSTGDVTPGRQVNVVYQLREYFANVLLIWTQFVMTPSFQRFLMTVQVTTGVAGATAVEEAKARFIAMAAIALAQQIFFSYRTVGEATGDWSPLQATASVPAVLRKLAGQYGAMNDSILGFRLRVMEYNSLLRAIVRIGTYCRTSFDVIDIQRYVDLTWWIDIQSDSYGSACASTLIDGWLPGNTIAGITTATLAVGYLLGPNPVLRNAWTAVTGRGLFDVLTVRLFSNNLTRKGRAMDTFQGIPLRIDGELGPQPAALPAPPARAPIYDPANVNAGIPGNNFKAAISALYEWISPWESAFSTSFMMMSSASIGDTTGSLAVLGLVDSSNPPVTTMIMPRTITPTEASLNICYPAVGYAVHTVPKEETCVSRRAHYLTDVDLATVRNEFVKAHYASNAAGHSDLGH